MPNSTTEQLSFNQERLVSPSILADLFNIAVVGILRTQEGQRLGSYVVPYTYNTRIKQHPVRGRVTHAEVIDYLPRGGTVVSHEVHFPSRDKQAGDFEASRAIFEVHEYDDAGNRIYTERTVLDVVDLAGDELRPFIEQLPAQ